MAGPGGGAGAARVRARGSTRPGGRRWHRVHRWPRTCASAGTAGHIDLPWSTEPGRARACRHRTMTTWSSPGAPRRGGGLPTSEPGLDAGTHDLASSLRHGRTGPPGCPGQKTRTAPGRAQRERHREPSGLVALQVAGARRGPHLRPTTTTGGDPAVDPIATVHVAQAQHHRHRLAGWVRRRRPGTGRPGGPCRRGWRSRGPPPCSSRSARCFRRQRPWSGRCSPTASRGRPTARRDRGGRPHEGSSQLRVVRGDRAPNQAPSKERDLHQGDEDDVRCRARRDGR